jgi:hypothetical protein
MIDEINVEVFIIILFEFSWLEIFFLNFSFQYLQVFNKLFDDFIIILTCWFRLSLLIIAFSLFSRKFDDNFFRDILWYFNSFNDLSDVFNVSVFWNLEGESNQI